MFAADPGVRLAALNSAGQHYRAFLHRCHQYGLLSPPAAALVEAALQQGDEEDGVASSGGSARSMDAATLRQNKIEKFKREKYIKSRLEALEQQQQSGGAAAEEDGGDGGRDGEEVERELWMLQADLAALQVRHPSLRLLHASQPAASFCASCTHVRWLLGPLAAHEACDLHSGPCLLQAAERLGLLRQEVEILRHAAAMPEDQRQRARQQREAAGPPTDLIRQLQAAAGNLTLSTSGSAAVQRQQLAAGVFGPSHVLPTMSVEQFGELEYRRMLEQQQREAATKERQQREQAERRADDVEEEEVQKVG